MNFISRLWRSIQRPFKLSLYRTSYLREDGSWSVDWLDSDWKRLASLPALERIKRREAIESERNATGWKKECTFRRARSNGTMQEQVVNLSAAELESRRPILSFTPRFSAVRRELTIQCGDQFTRVRMLPEETPDDCFNRAERCHLFVGFDFGRTSLGRKSRSSWYN